MSKKKRVTIRTPQEALRHIARITRQHYNEEIDAGFAKTQAYLVNSALAIFKHLADLRIEERIDKLEAKLEEQNK